MLQRIVARNLARVRTRADEPVRRAGGDDLDEGVIRRLENQQTQNIYLDALYEICRHYSCSLLSIVQSTRRLEPWPDDYPEYDELDKLVRRRLRLWRIQIGLGTPTVARMAKIHQPWIVRIESGEYKKLDLVRLDRVARVPLKRSLVALLTPEPETLPRTRDDEGKEERGAGTP